MPFKRCRMNYWDVLANKSIDPSAFNVYLLPDLKLGEETCPLCGCNSLVHRARTNTGSHHLSARIERLGF